MNVIATHGSRRKGKSGSTQQAATLAFCCASLLCCLPWVVAAQNAPAQNPAQETKGSSSPTMEADPSQALLESGYRHLYELDFQAARSDFLAYEKAEPNDPMGKASEAACYLYEEFNAKGVLTSDFFLNDQTFLGGVAGKLADNQNPQFLQTNQQAREMAAQQLKLNSRDPRALLAITIADGMESDYDAIIAKKQLPALGLMKQAEAEANTLLAIDPDAKDAYVALGASNYIIGSMPAVKRMFVWFDGVHGDKVHGMELMRLAADNGHYLRPFAKVLLALAYRREHQDDRARLLLAELTAEFPTNPLFAHELALLDQHQSAAN